MPTRAFNNLPKMALVALNITSVTPTVKVSGGGGTSATTAATAAGSAVAAGVTGATTLGGGLGTTISL